MQHLQVGRGFRSWRGSQCFLGVNEAPKTRRPLWGYRRRVRPRQGILGKQGRVSGSLYADPTLMIRLPLRSFLALWESCENDRDRRSRANRPRGANLQQHGLGWGGGWFGRVGGHECVSIGLKGTKLIAGGPECGLSSPHLLGIPPQHVSHFRYSVTVLSVSGCVTHNEACYRLRIDIATVASHSSSGMAHGRNFSITPVSSRWRIARPGQSP